MFLILCGGCYLALLVGKAIGAGWYARRHPAAPARASFADVTVLQPILGGDPALAPTLAANLVTLRGAQFVWLLDADDDPGRIAAEAARAMVPVACVELVLCPPPPRIQNPKLFKLALAEAQVSTPYFAVIDDDTRVSASGLATLLEALREHDVATGLPCYHAAGNLPSRLVAQFVNNQSVLTYLPLLLWQPPLTLNGMAYAMCTARWRELGGFAPLVHHLTDDLAVAERVRSTGGRIFQSAVPHIVSTTVRDWRHYAQVMHRWFFFAQVLVRAQSPRWQFAILGLHGLPPLLLWGAILALAFTPTWAGAGGLLGLVFARALVIATVQAQHFGRSLHAPATSLVAELLQPLHLVHALVCRQIHWRSRVIAVRSDTEFSRV